MARKKNILFVVAALVLIPIVLGLTPVKFFQKLGGCCPFSQNNAALSCDPCIYNSVTSQGETGDLVLAALPSSSSVISSLPIVSGETLGPDRVIISNPSIESPPLRR